MADIRAGGTGKCRSRRARTWRSNCSVLGSRRAQDTMPTSVSRRGRGAAGKRVRECVRWAEVSKGQIGRSQAHLCVSRAKASPRPAGAFQSCLDKRRRGAGCKLHIGQGPLSAHSLHAVTDAIMAPAQNSKSL
jgi:hypothetical protein